ncbi:MAG: hypothetical protein IIZ33_09200 [Erysipelotrichaceae bacterium]|nr:hypothetical protein [Erysipelotrichaceae bacterium]
MSNTKKTSKLFTVSGAVFRIILAAVSIYLWVRLFLLFEEQLSSLLRRYVPMIPAAGWKAILIVLIVLFLIFFLKEQIEVILGHPLFRKKNK